MTIETVLLLRGAETIDHPQSTGGGRDTLLVRFRPCAPRVDRASTRATSDSGRAKMRLTPLTTVRAADMLGRMDPEAAVMTRREILDPRAGAAAAQERER